jgi:dephospho-CoA kinase
MLLIGLTGGIASGKTFVSDCFAKLGAVIIDADQLARDVVTPGSKGLNALIGHFGPTILTPEGILNRQQLRKLVFDNAENRAFVESTLHPLIRSLSEEKIENARKTAVSYSIYAVPLLVETNQQLRFDRIAVVDIPVELQIERLTQRDQSSIEQARKILDAQATREQRLDVADDVIDNSGTKADTRARVSQLHDLYAELSQQPVR